LKNSSGQQAICENAMPSRDCAAQSETYILLGMAGLDAFDADAQAQPPHGQLAQVE
jgi:hypothetical protein